MKEEKTVVAVIKGEERSIGIKRAMRLVGGNPVSGKKVLIKPNFNTADPFPASTHNDTLKAIIEELDSMGAAKVTIGERSGPVDTSTVLERKGIHSLADSLGVEIINFEENPPGDWILFNPEGSHWKRGFLVARQIVDAECVVSTCCLKTHGFGGGFTMSLKNSVGIVHKKNMRELHTSFFSMRKMIAEVNMAYNPAMIVMDGMEVFSDGGPSSGERKRAEVFISGTDRVAVDAVGLAVLKNVGTKNGIQSKGVFEQQQIARAVELGLGVGLPRQIELAGDDEKSIEYARVLAEILGKER